MKAKSGLGKLISLAVWRTTAIDGDQTLRTIRLALGLALFGVLSVTQASAGASTRSFVSGNGNDNNPCSPEAPCRTFAHAITQTDAGGEIIVMDSAAQCQRLPFHSN